MEIQFQVQMTAKNIYRFLLYHTYTKWQGGGTVLIGISLITMGLMRFIYPSFELLKWCSIEPFFMIFFGFLILSYTPFHLWSNAKRQGKSPAFCEPIEYSLKEEGIALRRGEESITVPWENVVKVRETGSLLLLYTSRLKAFILPKEFLQEQYLAVREIVKMHVPAKYVRLKGDS